MTWFKVDDSFHSHPKTTAVSLAAVGLWAVAGSWSGDHLTDGFVPDHMLPLLCRGATELADELVAAGLWKRARKGYRFHQWSERNPQATDVLALRAKRAAAGRSGGLASGKVRSKRQANASADASRVVEPPTRPSALTEQRGTGLAPAREGAPGAAPSNRTHGPPIFSAQDERDEDARLAALSNAIVAADLDQDRTNKRGAAAARAALAKANGQLLPSVAARLAAEANPT